MTRFFLAVLLFLSLGFDTQAGGINSSAPATEPESEALIETAVDELSEWFENPLQAAIVIYDEAIGAQVRFRTRSATMWYAFYYSPDFESAIEFQRTYPAPGNRLNYWVYGLTPMYSALIYNSDAVVVSSIYPFKVSKLNTTNGTWSTPKNYAAGSTVVLSVSTTAYGQLRVEPFTASGQSLPPAYAVTNWYAPAQ
ncbi:MAG: hypothetical protein KBD00_02495 [Candidatus Peribacteraceae bacterium]|nr:hypothetical protein [Candidatus Peribacteraceae bacterium]